jgi:hypothetical protein
MDIIYDIIVVLLFLIMFVFSFVHRKQRRQRLSTTLFKKMFFDKKEGFNTITLYHDLNE